MIEITRLLELSQLVDQDSSGLEIIQKRTRELFSLWQSENFNWEPVEGLLVVGLDVKLVDAVYTNWAKTNFVFVPHTRWTDGQVFPGYHALGFLDKHRLAYKPSFPDVGVECMVINEPGAKGDLDQNVVKEFKYRLLSLKNLVTARKQRRFFSRVGPGERPGWTEWEFITEREFYETLDYIDHGYRYECRTEGGPTYRRHTYEVDSFYDVTATKASPDAGFVTELER